MVVLASLIALFSLMVLGLILGCELGVRRFYPVSSEKVKGLGQSLKFALELEPVGRIPQIIVFQDPLPEAFALRAWGGRGTVFLSQGLLCQLTEAELRQTLKAALLGLSLKRVPYESACWWLTLLLRRWAPKGWVQLNLSKRRLNPSFERTLTPVSAILFWIFYPILTFLADQSGARRVDFGNALGTLPLKRKLIWSNLLSGHDRGKSRGL